MAKSYRKHNLVKARSTQHNKSEELETDSGQSDLDCGYEGGIDCDPSNDEEDSEDDEWSDDESLAELEGDELEANLSALCEEAESWDNNPAMGALDVSVDGCLQSGYGNNRCPETGEEFQFHKVQVTSVCS